MRKQFLWHGEVVQAAGYLLRCGREFLMIHEQAGWGDLGGKSEYEDGSPRETAAREAAEESKDSFPDVSELPCKEYYNRRSKYLLHVVDVDSKTRVSSPLGWVKAPRLTDLHPRLRYHPQAREIFGRRSAIPYFPARRPTGDAGRRPAKRRRRGSGSGRRRGRSRSSG